MTDTIFEPLAQSSWGWTLARSLAHLLWQGALLAALLALTLRFTPSRRSRLRYGLALAVLAAFPLLLTLDLALILRLGAGVGAAPGSLHAALGQLSTPFAPVSSPLRLDVAWAGLGVTLYALGAALLASRLLGQIFYLRRLQRTAVPVDEALCARLHRLARLVGTRVPRLAFSSRVDTAMVMGWRAPLVLLPARVGLHLTPRQLDSVLLHELVHIKTHDCAANAFQLLVETLLFYHPALWWVSGVVRQEREYRCDDLAARACGDRHGYVEALLALEKARSRPTAVVALAGTSGDFAARIRRLFGYPVARADAARLSLRCLVALTLGVSAGFAQPPAQPPSAQSVLQPEPRTTERMAEGRGGNVPKRAARPFGEPTSTGCAALGGRWFHIKMPMFGVEPQPPISDPDMSVPLETPDVTFPVKTPGATFRGRCMIERPAE